MPDVEWLDEEQRTWRLYQAMSPILETSLDRQLQRSAVFTDSPLRCSMLAFGLVSAGRLPVRA